MPLRPRIIGWRRNGAPIWLAQGGSEPAPEPTPPTPGTDPGTRTYSEAEHRAELQRVGANQKREGKQAAAKELADQLGVTVDEAKAIIAAHRDAADKDKTDAQKAREAADTARAAADSERAQAAAERHAARVERALVTAGVALPADEKAHEGALAKVARLVDAEVGADAETIATAVAATKAEFPQMFGQAAKTAPNGDPPGSPPAPGNGEDSYARGARLAQEGLAKGRRPYEIVGTRPVFGKQQ